MSFTNNFGRLLWSNQSINQSLFKAGNMAQQTNTGNRHIHKYTKRKKRKKSPLNTAWAPNSEGLKPLKSPVKVSAYTPLLVLHCRCLHDSSVHSVPLLVYGKYALLTVHNTARSTCCHLNDNASSLSHSPTIDISLISLWPILYSRAGSIYQTVGVLSIRRYRSYRYRINNGGCSIDIASVAAKISVIFDILSHFSAGL